MTTGIHGLNPATSFPDALATFIQSNVRTVQDLFWLFTASCAEIGQVLGKEGCVKMLQVQVQHTQRLPDDAFNLHPRADELMTVLDDVLEGQSVSVSDRPTEDDIQTPGIQIPDIQTPTKDGDL